MQLALWEEYADEVEEQMRVLLADNALLQAALADVRSSLSHERPSSAGASGARPAFRVIVVHAFLLSALVPHVPARQIVLTAIQQGYEEKLCTRQGRRHATTPN